MMPGTMWNAAHDLLAFEGYCCVAAMTRRRKVRCRRQLANAPTPLLQTLYESLKLALQIPWDKSEGMYEMLAILAGVSHLVPGTLWSALVNASNHRCAAHKWCQAPCGTLGRVAVGWVSAPSSMLAFSLCTNMVPGILWSALGNASNRRCAAHKWCQAPCGTLCVIC